MNYIVTTQPLFCKLLSRFKWELTSYSCYLYYTNQRLDEFKNGRPWKSYLVFKNHITHNLVIFILLFLTTNFNFSEHNSFRNHKQDTYHLLFQWENDSDKIWTISKDKYGTTRIVYGYKYFFTQKHTFCSFTFRSRHSCVLIVQGVWP